MSICTDCGINEATEDEEMCQECFDNNYVDIVDSISNSEIEKLIKVYEIRIKAVSKIMAETQDIEKLLRGAGKHEAYVGIVIDLKELLPK